MIKRLVKLTFLPDKTDAFLTIFEESRRLIRASEGCLHLEALRDVDSPHIFFTYSYWKDKGALERYRVSKLFRSTWAKTKPLFAVKAEAWTLEELP